MRFAKQQGMPQRRVSSANILSVKPAVTNTADASCKAMPPGGSTKSGTVKSASARQKDDASARDNERAGQDRSAATVYALLRLRFNVSNHDAWHALQSRLGRDGWPCARGQRNSEVYKWIENLVAS